MNSIFSVKEALKENNISSESKVIFFNAHTLWPVHIDTELEIITEIQKTGAKILRYKCVEAFQSCDLNLTKNKSVCDLCVTKHELIDVLANKKIESIAISLGKKQKSIVDEYLNSVESLKEYYHKNYDIGMATLSSIISELRDPYIKISDYQNWFEKYISNGIALYDYFLESLKEVNPDFVFIFNGRFVYERALVRACEALNIKYCTHERGSSKSKYMLFFNTLPHDIDYYHKKILDTWENSQESDQKKIEISQNFFNQRRNGQEQAWLSFTAEQRIGELPKNFDAKYHNIGIFLSSEDEFVAIDKSWENGFFQNQIFGLNQILKSGKINDEIRFYIRIHPNSKDLHSFLDQIRKFNSDKICVIEPDSEISTYTLIDNLDKIITFGSTVSVESVYWKKPTMIVGNSMYKKFDVSFLPKNLDEIFLWINNLKIQNNEPSEIIFQFGYYSSIYGYDYNYYKPEDLFYGKIFGYDLNSKSKDLASNKLKKQIEFTKIRIKRRLNIN
jgi:hypothetical protein